MITVAEKCCRSPECEQQNPQSVTQFYRTKRSKDGLQSYCIRCLVKRRRKSFVPAYERDSNPFEATGLYRKLGLTRTGAGMARMIASQIQADLMPDEPQKAKATKYLCAESIVNLLNQVDNLVLRMIDEGMKDNE